MDEANRWKSNAHKKGKKRITLTEIQIDEEKVPK